MRASLERQVLFSEVDRDFRMKLTGMLRLFQDVAALHSEQIGFGIRKLASEGITWVLSRLWIEVERYPEYGETLTAFSWSRGSNGFRMLRDFEIRSGAERVAAGSSVWFFVNARAKRVERVPAAIDEAYEAEPTLALGKSVEDWNPSEGLEATALGRVQPRYSDLDASEHVNNTLYCAYVMDVLTARLGGARDVTSMKLQFSRAIDDTLGEVEVGLTPDGDTVHFRVGAAREFFARGELRRSRPGAA
jgi:medium-chain acyl-[acyl-carrier-protein] hydrolase